MSRRLLKKIPIVGLKHDSKTKSDSFDRDYSCIIAWLQQKRKGDKTNIVLVK